MLRDVEFLSVLGAALSPPPAKRKRSANEAPVVGGEAAQAVGWSDWITAAATTATALVGALAVWLALLTYRREARKELPLVESDVSLGDAPDIGRFVLARLVVKNRIDETLIVNRIAVLRPKGAVVSLGRQPQPPDHGGVFPARGESNAVSPARNVLPSETPFGRRSMSGAEFTLFVCPPSAWTPAPLRIEVVMSSKASTIRDRRIIVKTRAPPAIASQTDAKASKAG
jgi:hypothetical protein